ncbi:hypothetical protein TN53_18470 [Streptomyces sp. WM6386]|nr:hypothetical protein TN53_18470 [Streptomyces sp. WM6386]
MEVAGALLSIAVVLVPAMKDLVDSVAYRNRAQGRAALIRARRSEERRQRGLEPGEERGRSLD